MQETNEAGNEPIEISSYEDALEQAALAQMEINEIFKASASRQKKLWKLIFDEEGTSKFDFVKKLLVYKIDVPKEGSKAKAQVLRDQVQGMMELMVGMGNEDTLKSYFAEVGIDISLKHNKYDSQKFKVNEKIQNLWDLEFFGEKMPTHSAEILKRLMDAATNTEVDIIQTKRHINDNILEVACERFEIAHGAFKKAVDLTVAEKNGKDVLEKIEEIERGREILDKALEHFTSQE